MAVVGRNAIGRRYPFEKISRRPPLLKLLPQFGAQLVQFLDPGRVLVAAIIRIKHVGGLRGISKPVCHMTAPAIGIRNFAICYLPQRCRVRIEAVSSTKPQMNFATLVSMPQRSSQVGNLALTTLI